MKKLVLLLLLSTLAFASDDSEEASKKAAACASAVTAEQKETQIYQSTLTHILSEKFHQAVTLAQAKGPQAFLDLFQFTPDENSEGFTAHLDLHVSMEDMQKHMAPVMELFWQKKATQIQNATREASVTPITEAPATVDHSTKPADFETLEDTPKRKRAGKYAGALYRQLLNDLPSVEIHGVSFGDIGGDQGFIVRVGFPDNVPVIIDYFMKSRGNLIHLGFPVDVQVTVDIVPQL